MEIVAKLSCVDQPGIVNAVTSAILAGSGNILENQQFTDPTTNRFLMRTKFVTGLQVSEVSQLFNQSLQKFNVDLEILPAEYRKKVIIFVSKESHCLRDLIYLTEISKIGLEPNQNLVKHFPLLKTKSLEIRTYQKLLKL